MSITLKKYIIKLIIRINNLIYITNETIKLNTHIIKYLIEYYLSNLEIH